MIRSMTGFGRTSFEAAGIAYELEVRTVNHRFLDLRLRIPPAVAARESELRRIVQQRLRRGKVEISVRTAPGEGREQEIAFDYGTAERYLEAALDFQRRHGLSGAIDVGTLLRLPGVAGFAERVVEPDALFGRLQQALDSALGAVQAMREAEGRTLAGELEARLDRVSDWVRALEERSDLVVQAGRERLRKRAEQLQDEVGELDAARLHQEIVLAADRLDVSEEIARLRSHVDQFRAILATAPGDEPAGRRLGFLLQEMGREANTIGAKGADAPVAHMIVELKTEIERIREQAQNIE